MNTDSPLFAAIPDNACQAYLNLRDSEHRHAQDGRQHCEDIWNDFAQLADDHFLAEFPIRLHERWFEMYLTVSLLRARLTVACPKPGPDILLTDRDSRIWIEAVCATPGEAGRPDSVPTPQYAKLGEKPIVTSVPQDQSVLRLRNSLEEKARKYNDYLKKGIVDLNDVLVIAINVHAVPTLARDMEDFMMRALYGVGNHIITLAVSTGDIVGRDREQITAIAKKSTGAEVGVQPFIDGSMPQIAAVLGSRSDAVNLPRRLGDDFGLFPNLTPQMAWTKGSIGLGEEWSFVEAEGEWQGQKSNYIEGN